MIKELTPILFLGLFFIIALIFVFNYERIFAFLHLPGFKKTTSKQETNKNGYYNR